MLQNLLQGPGPQIPAYPQVFQHPVRFSNRYSAYACNYRPPECGLATEKDLIIHLQPPHLCMLPRRSDQHSVPLRKIRLCFHSDIKLLRLSAIENCNWQVAHMHSVWGVPDGMRPEFPAENERQKSFRPHPLILSSIETISLIVWMVLQFNGCFKKVIAGLACFNMSRIITGQPRWRFKGGLGLQSSRPWGGEV